MELNLLKNKFHNLIDEIDNQYLLEHFFELMSNLVVPNLDNSMTTTNEFDE